MVVQVLLSEEQSNRLKSDNKNLADFIDWLDTLETRPSLSVLDEKLSKLELDLNKFGNVLGYTENGYQRNVIKKTKNYEIVLICWKPGQKTPIHDHFGSDCAFLILDGVSTETIFVESDNHLKVSKKRRYEPGEVCAANEPDIHQISNFEDGNLVNLHVYSPPLKDFNIYGDDLVI